jgi:glutamate 5-kinase
LDLDVIQTKVEAAEAAFKLGVAWALHQDKASLEAALAKDNQRKETEKAAREKAKRASAETRASDAAVKAARLKVEAEAVKAGKSEEELKEELKAFDDANGLVDGKKPKAEATPATK